MLVSKAYATFVLCVRRAAIGCRLSMHDSKTHIVAGGVGLRANCYGGNLVLHAHGIARVRSTIINPPTRFVIPALLGKPVQIGTNVSPCARVCNLHITVSLATVARRDDGVRVQAS
jgi:hypothetical protein